MKDLFDRPFQTIIRDRIASNEMTVLKEDSWFHSENEKPILAIENLLRYCNLVDTDNLILEGIKEIKFDRGFATVSERFLSVLLKLENVPLTTKFIVENFDSILNAIINTTYSAGVAKSIPTLFAKYGQDYDGYLNNDRGFSNIYRLLNSLVENYEDSMKREKMKEIMEFDEVKELYEDIHEKHDELKGVLFPDIYFFSEKKPAPDVEFWEEKIEENLVREARSDAEEEVRLDFFKLRLETTQNEDKSIEDLFDRQG
jgi:hypothetical protein